VLAALRAASSFDPSHPLYQRDLGIWLLADGQPDVARAHLARAVDGNHGDPVARRALAMAMATAGDERALSVVRELIARRPDDAVSHLTLAWVARELGADQEVVDGSLDQALRYEPWMTATDAWHVQFGDDVVEDLRAALASWQSNASGAREHHRARAWLAAMVGQSLDDNTVSTADAGAAAVIDCRFDDAKEALGPGSTSGLDADGLLVRILEARARGELADGWVTLAGLRSPIIAFLATNEVEEGSPLLAIGFDVQFYGRRALPLPSNLPAFPTPESGLSAWLRDPVAAADRGAPESGLAACR
jgi:hypothetical protein